MGPHLRNRQTAHLEEWDFFSFFSSPHSPILLSSLILETYFKSTENLKIDTSLKPLLDWYQ